MLSDEKQVIKIKLWNWRQNFKLAVDDNVVVTNVYLDHYDEKA